MRTTRRNFMKKMGYAITLIVILPVLLGLSSCTNENLKCISNPYEKVNWEKDEQVCSTTHLHITKQEHLDNAYAGSLRHFAISNYYPAVPYYPLNKIRKNQFWVRQDHAVVVNGKLKQGPFNWNDIIMDKDTGWYDELDPNTQKTLPFKVGDYIFKNIPNDIAESPNAEHHSFANSNAHINCPGSFFRSGTFDTWNNAYKDKSRYQLVGHGYSRGGLKWQQAFGQMLEELQFADGGGITINHPVWSGLKMTQIYEMLDYDDRVLGIEIWNSTTEKINEKGFALETWDKILATGRRCYGFSVPDHSHKNKDKNWKGRNYLLVPKFNERECLKAYRQGRFYCALLGNGLRFEEISFTKGVLSVKINKQASIKIISDKGVFEENGSSIVYEVPVENGKFAVTYIRIEVEDETGERIFSQPVMLKSGKTKDQKNQ